MSLKYFVNYEMLNGILRDKILSKTDLGYTFFEILKFDFPNNWGKPLRNSKHIISYQKPPKTVMIGAILLVKSCSL